jgi:hypothetical protein
MKVTILEYALRPSENILTGRTGHSDQQYLIVVDAGRQFHSRPPPSHPTLEQKPFHLLHVVGVMTP